MVVKVFKRQIKSGNGFNDRLINVVFSNHEPTTINELLQAVIVDQLRQVHQQDVS